MKKATRGLSIYTWFLKKGENQKNILKSTDNREIKCQKHRNSQ